MAKLKPSVFVRAARLLIKSNGVGGNAYACNAIIAAAFANKYSVSLASVSFFGEVFQKQNTYGRWWPNFSEKSQLARSIALLLCAEMARDLTDEK